ncbi:DUF4403 family protein [Sphingomonas soli]|uniref:DUF4403 family protein n=1 Tax=Sphingomonas soli TaxID=266127 RepID=UPI000B15F262|nr:DUF4403 family protein [Sphingomonas soli]
MSTDAQAPAGFRRHRIAIIAAALIVLAAAIAAILFWSRNTSLEPPPRVNDPVETPQQASLIAVPLEADVSALSQALERAIPRTLWTINQKFDKCVEGQRVKLFRAKIKVTPDLSCTVTGTVTRGAIRLRGEGELIIADIPINAAISAKNVAGVLKETATGSAMAHARVRLTLREDWTPVAKVDLSYGWTTPPGIDFLGQRITFTEQADEKLRPIVADLERDLPKELAKLDVRAKVADAWRQSFTALLLNEANPSVWMRVTPKQLSYGGYSLAGNKLRLSLSMEAGTETFVGPRPEDPKPTPLPALQKELKGNQLRFFIPVIADYSQLEPVVLKALVKRSARPFDLPGLGPVTAKFGKVTAYGTTGGRIAMGLDIAARPQSSTEDTVGTVWISARPVNEKDSRKVSFTDLEVRGKTNGIGGDLLVQLVNSPALSEVVAGALTQNFTNDFEKLLGKIHRAIEQKREGDFVIRADITKVETGELRAAGQGIYLPVWADGTARVQYVPH